MKTRYLPIVLVGPITVAGCGIAEHGWDPDWQCHEEQAQRSRDTIAAWGEIGRAAGQFELDHPGALLPWLST
jgi:hypothetical protein